MDWKQTKIEKRLPEKNVISIFPIFENELEICSSAFKLGFIGNLYFLNLPISLLSFSLHKENTKPPLSSKWISSVFAIQLMGNKQFQYSLVRCASYDSMRLNENLAYTQRVY